MQRLQIPGFLFLLSGLALAQGTTPRDAWQQFQREQGNAWTAEWITSTGTPRAIYGQGLKVATALNTLDEARIQSTALLERYKDLLGRGDSRFVEADASRIRHLYYFIYRQQFAGLDVIGGRADVRINERGVVAMFGSSAVPVPQTFQTEPQLAAAAAQAIAEGKYLGQVRNGAGVPAPRLVIWARTEDGVRAEPKLAWEVQLDARSAQVLVAKVFVDARTGAVLEFANEVFSCGSCSKLHVPSTRGGSRLERAMAKARDLRGAARSQPSTVLALTGKVMAWTNVGAKPTDALTNVPVANVLVTSSAGNAYTDDGGNFTIPYTGSTAVTCTATLQGRHTQRVKVEAGTQLTASTAISPTGGGTIQFGSPTMAEPDWAQTTIYHFVDDINRYIRALVPGSASTMDQLSTQLVPTVNIDRSCNAFYSNYSINHFRRRGMCDMTAFSSIIQHEWGHGLDDAFGGIQTRDGLSEGWADVVAVLRGNDPIIGNGFFLGGGIVRTALNTRTYPVNSQDLHDMGEVWMGWVWDVKLDMEARLGTAAGYDRTQKIVIPTIVANAGTMAVQIREVFLLDDDDGNLNNGTPNYASLEKASLKRTVPYPKRANPHAGTYSSFGNGCPGSGTISSWCAAANQAGGILTGGANANVFALAVPPATGVTVIEGFELFTQSNSLPVTIPTQIYLADSAGSPAAVPARTGTMTVGSTAGWYRTTFAIPLTIPANQAIFLSYTPAVDVRAPYLSTGTLASHFWRAATATTWNGPFSALRWAWRLDCRPASGAATPLLSFEGLPELGRSFSLGLTAARPNATGLLFVGGSDRLWQGLALPFNLAGFGAPACDLLSSGELQIPIQTNALGFYGQTFTVPNQAGLFGAQFFNQFLVSDPANPFGIVFSNGGVGQIGKQ